MHAYAKKKQFDEREQDWLVQNFCLWQPPRLDVIQAEPCFSSSLKNTKLEACLAERLTPWTQDLEVWGLSLTHRIVSLHKKLYSTLSLFTQAPVVQKVDRTIHWINHHAVYNAIGVCTTYLLDSDLSGG